MSGIPITNKKTGLKITIIRFTINILAAIFLMVFIIEKSYSAPGMEISEERIEQKPIKKVIKHTLHLLVFENILIAMTAMILNTKH